MISKQGIYFEGSARCRVLKLFEEAHTHLNVFGVSLNTFFRTAPAHFK
jgi:hypothetical protein